MTAEQPTNEELQRRLDAMHNLYQEMESGSIKTELALKQAISKLHAQVENLAWVKAQKVRAEDNFRRLVADIKQVFKSHGVEEGWGDDEQLTTLEEAAGAAQSYIDDIIEELNRIRTER